MNRITTFSGLNRWMAICCVVINIFSVLGENNITSTTNNNNDNNNALEAISVCNIISPHLPQFCECVNYISNPTMAQLNCSVTLPYHVDTLKVVSTLAPCADPAYIKIRVVDGKKHIDHTFGPITATGMKELPIPYLSIHIPEVGEAGVTAAVELGGNLEQLDVSIGIDACIKVRSKEECGSDLTKKLPIWILKHDFSFSSLCDSTKGFP